MSADATPVSPKICVAMSGRTVRSWPTIAPMSAWTPTSRANWPALARSPSDDRNPSTRDSGAAGRVARPDPLEPAALELAARAAPRPTGGRRASSSSASARSRARRASATWALSWSEATRSRGKPDWASPSTSPSRRSSKSRSASSKPSRISVTALSRAWAVSSVGVGDEHAERLHGATADPAAKLVELGEPEPVGALDDHHRRLRDVDPDLDDGRPDEDVQLAVAEPGHLGVAVGGLHPAMDHPDAERSEQIAKPNGLRLRGRGGRVEDRRRGVVRGRVGLIDQGTTTNVR